MSTGRLGQISAFFLLISGLYGCGPQASPASAPNAEQPAAPQPAVEAVSPMSNEPTNSLVDAKPAATLTAFEWADQAKADNNFVITKYAGKVLELTGEVTDVFSSSLALKAAKEVKDITRDLVACEMQDKDFWKKVFVGQTVRLRARAPKSTFATEFKWELIEVKGPKPPTITAQDWAKDFGTDESAAEKKFMDRPVILTGEIEKVEPNPGGVASVYLKAEGTSPVQCRFPVDSDELINSLKPGQKVSLLFKYTQLGIWNCKLLERDE